jgi:hypothetical protein
MKSQGLETAQMTLQANSSTLAAPTALRKTQFGTAIRVEPATCAIGAELSGVYLGDASRDEALFEIQSLLLKHKVLFLND